MLGQWIVAWSNFSSLSSRPCFLKGCLRERRKATACRRISPGRVHGITVQSIVQIRWGRSGTNSRATKKGLMGFTHKSLKFVVRLERFELPAYRFVACCSIQLSHSRIRKRPLSRVLRPVKFFLRPCAYFFGQWISSTGESLLFRRDSMHGHSLFSLIWGTSVTGSLNRLRRIFLQRSTFSISMGQGAEA